jgi:hypothetical protein
MKTSHWIRAHMIDRKANALLRRASRPHKQSAHMIGRSRLSIGPEALVSAVVAIALFVVFNLIFTEQLSADPVAPAQVANQK